jgi:DNA-directed RNA polymerase sigma subunit (sigma70/sigma32)
VIVIGFKLPGVIKMSSEQNPEHSDTGRKKLVISSEQREVLENLLSQLSPREAMILRWRYGLEDGYFHTLCEVAHEIGVAGERTRQLEARVMTRLGENSVHFTQLEYVSDEN